MATRYERVVLDVESQLAAVFARDTAAAKGLERALNSLDGSTVNVGRSMSPLGEPGGPIASTGRQSATATAQLDRFTGRMRLAAEAVAVFGPAAIPITAVAIPAVSGLAAQFGFAALAGGAAIVAFQGVGDALKAVNKAHLEPTAENLAKARAAMYDLSPAARRLVGELREFTPLLKEIRDAAAAGIMPGFSEALDNISARLPDVERILAEVADTVGDLMADGAASLSSARWDEFFTFLETDARSALTELATSVGNVTHGLAELWMAFDPLNDSFSRWMVDATSGFDAWAEGLSQTEGFAEFVDYIRANGPKVADALGSIGNMLLQVVEAAAPLGGPVLEAIAAVADVVAAVADSDLGTPLFAGLAAMTLFTRATKVWGATSVVSAREFVAGQAQALAATRTSAASMTVLARNTMTAGAASQRMAAQSAIARTNLAKQAAVAGKAAGAAGLLAVAMTDLDDSAGLTNTTMGALIGMMAGPYGAAAGAGIGLALDAAAANDDLEQSIRAVNDALAAADPTTNLYAINEGIRANRASFAEFKDDVESVDFTSLSSILGGIKNDVEDTFGRSDVEEFAEQIKAAEIQASILKGTFEGNWFQKALGIGDAPGKFEHLSTAIDQTSHAGLRLLSSMERQKKALAASRKAAGDTASAFINLGDGLNDAKVSLGDWLKQLESQADALRNFRVNAERAADKGLRGGLIAALREAGPEGALRMRQLANATDAEIDRANAAWKRGQQEIKRYTDAVGGVPTAKTTKITAETRQAMGALGSVREFIASINDKDVTIRVHTVRTSSDGVDYMSGGNQTTSDKNDRPLVPRSTTFTPEPTTTYVVGRSIVGSTYTRTADGGGTGSKGGGKQPPYNLPETKGGRTPRFDALLAEWLKTIRHLNHMSDKELSHRTGLIHSLKDEMVERRHNLRERERMLEKELRHAENKWQAERDLLKDMRAARRDLLQQTAGNFMSGLFGEVDLEQAARDGLLGGDFMSGLMEYLRANNIEMAPGTMVSDYAGQYLATLTPQQIAALQGQAQMGTLQQDTRNAQQFQALLEQLTALGFDGGAFAELAMSGNASQAQFLASQGADYISWFEQMYEQRNAAAQGAGQSAANAAWADAIKEQTKEARGAREEFREARHSLHRIEGRLEDVERAIGKLPEPVGREVGKAVNGAVASGQRSA